MDWSKCFQLYERKYRVHAIQRMIQRDISFADIDEASKELELVEEYRDTTPYPSCLVLGFTGKKRPLHIVFAANHEARIAYIITVYEPESTKWSEDFKRRIK